MHFPPKTAMQYVVCDSLFWYWVEFHKQSEENGKIRSWWISCPTLLMPTKLLVEFYSVNFGYLHLAWAILCMRELVLHPIEKCFNCLNPWMEQWRCFVPNTVPRMHFPVRNDLRRKKGKSHSWFSLPIMYVDIPGSEGFLCSGMCMMATVVAGEGKVMGWLTIYMWWKMGWCKSALLCPIKSLWDFFQFYFSLKLEQPKWFFFLLNYI